MPGYATADLAIGMISATAAVTTPVGTTPTGCLVKQSFAPLAPNKWVVWKAGNFEIVDHRQIREVSDYNAPLAPTTDIGAAVHVDETLLGDSPAPVQRITR